MMVVLVTLLTVLIWYVRVLNELKREAIAISAGGKVINLPIARPSRQDGAATEPERTGEREVKRFSYEIGGSQGTVVNW